MKFFIAIAIAMGMISTAQAHESSPCAIKQSAGISVIKTVRDAKVFLGNTYEENNASRQADLVCRQFGHLGAAGFDADFYGFRAITLWNPKRDATNYYSDHYSKYNFIACFNKNATAESRVAVRCAKNHSAGSKRWFKIYNTSLGKMPSLSAKFRYKTDEAADRFCQRMGHHYNVAHTVNLPRNAKDKVNFVQIVCRLGN